MPTGATPAAERRLKAMEEKKEEGRDTRASIRGRPRGKWPSQLLPLLLQRVCAAPRQRQREKARVATPQVDNSVCAARVRHDGAATPWLAGCDSFL